MFCICAPTSLPFGRTWWIYHFLPFASIFGPVGFNIVTISIAPTGLTFYHLLPIFTILATCWFYHFHAYRFHVLSALTFLPFLRPYRFYHFTNFIILPLFFILSFCRSRRFSGLAVITFLPFSATLPDVSFYQFTILAHMAVSPFYISYRFRRFWF